MTDCLMHRYSYRLHEVQALSLPDFYYVIANVSRAMKDEQRNGLILQAFNAWQIVETVRGALGGGKPTSFQQYLKSFGLTDSDEGKASQISPQDILQQAAETVAMDKARGVKS
jgi:hypothetical protein